MKTIAKQQSLKPALRKCGLALLLVSLALSVLPIQPGYASTHYIDSFSSLPVDFTLTDFKTGTTPTGLNYTCTNCYFQYSTGRMRALQNAAFLERSITITARDGDAFDFNSIRVDASGPIVITGYGPEPFVIELPVSFGIPVGPGTPLWVTRVEITPNIISSEFDVFFDDVDVVLYEPEIDIQRPAGRTISDGGIDNLGIVPTGTTTLVYTHANLGDSELRTSSVTASNLNNVSNFSVVGLHSSLSGGSTFMVLFDIDASGPFSLDMDITSNDANENPYDIRIQGIGDGDPPSVRSFARYRPLTSPTNADILVFRTTFDEDVQNVSAADFSVTGTTAGVIGVEPVGAASMRGVYPVAAGAYHTCAVESDGSLVCWGLDNYNQSSPPGGWNNAMVSAGEYHTCALKSDGSIDCWGRDGDNQTSSPSGSDYTLVSAGDSHNCALKIDGSLVCWGLNDDGQASPPAGTDFVMVGAGYRDTCALRNDGSLTCWGLNHLGQDNPPSGTDYTMVSSGIYYSCALKDDGSLTCWGYDGDGRASPPAGTDFALVSAGGTHACALRNNGSIVCWGENSYGQASPPAGTDFALVSAGRDHSCALKNDKSLVCWGYDEFGKASPPAGLSVSPVSNAVYDITVSGGDLAGLDGTVGLDLAPGQNITDLIGNPLPAGEPSIDETYLVDNQVPLINSFTIQMPPFSPTSADTLVFRAAFSEAVENVDSADFTAWGTTAAVTGVNPVSAAVYDVTLSGGDLAGLDGIVGLDLSVGQDVIDLLGNSLPAIEPGLDETYTVDNSGPVPEIDQAISQSDPTSIQPITFTVDFGERVTGFNAADLSFGGTAPGTPAAVINGGPQIYQTVISGLTGDGTLTMSFAPGAAQDLAGNPSAAPIVIDNLVSFDGDPEIDLQRPIGISIPDGGTDALGNRLLGPVSLTYTLDNTAGTDVLNVTEVEATNLMNASGFSLDTALPITVAGGELGTFDISFEVEVNGPFSFDLDLTSDDPDEGNYDLTLSGSGTGGQPAIEIQRPEGTAIICGGTDAVGTPGVGTVHLTYTIDNSAGTAQLDVTEVSPTGLSNVSNFQLHTGTPISVPAHGVGSFEISFDVLTEGLFSFLMAITNTDVPCIFELIGTAADLQVVMGGGTSPLDGDVLYTGPTDLQVQFSKEARSGGGGGAADNPGNYMLVEAGVDGELDTSSCLFGTGGDDQTITISGASYDVLSLTATLNIGPAPLPNGSYRFLICGTTSVQDLFDMELNGGLADTQIDFLVTERPSLPDTGFVPNRFTSLPQQPLEKQYQQFANLWLEIPSMDLQQAIIGVPQSAAGWDVTWLGDRIGYLNGTAFPTWNGNTVLTGHVYGASGSPGPFQNLSHLNWGEHVLIHAFGKIYTYEVRSLQNWVKPIDISSLTRHEDYDWITLITCRGYDESSGSYAYRTIVRAVLVQVEGE